MLKRNRSRSDGTSRDAWSPASAHIRAYRANAHAGGSFFQTLLVVRPCDDCGNTALIDDEVHGARPDSPISATTSSYDTVWCGTRRYGSDGSLSFAGPAGWITIIPRISTSDRLWISREVLNCEPCAPAVEPTTGTTAGDAAETGTAILNDTIAKATETLIRNPSQIRTRLSEIGGHRNLDDVLHRTRVLPHEYQKKLTPLPPAGRARRARHVTA